MNSNVSTVFWIYLGLVFLGGLMGYLKAGSKASIIASSIFAALLVPVALGMWPVWAGQAVAAFLLVYFGRKFIETRKPMPAGVMTGLSLVVLVLTFVLTRK